MERESLAGNYLSPQRVLDALPNSRRSAIDFEDLKDQLSARSSQLELLKQYLAELVRCGLVASGNRRYWRLKTPGLLIGTFSGSRAGHAFVSPECQLERGRGDLYIGARWTGSALHGDRVIARVTARSPRGREGRVEGVLWRANTTVVGRFEKSGRESFVIPLEEKFLHTIVVARSGTAGAHDEDIVVVEITRPPDGGRPPSGRILEILGREDAPGIDLQIIVRKHHLCDTFPTNVIDEADAIPETIDASDLRDRIDLREQLTVTIDGETARDFDDAISLSETESGRLRLGVHIADVSHYVRLGSALDEEAFRRGTSVYFPEKAIPMLPERLSNGVCSLNPRVDRLTLSVLLELNRSGRVLDYRLAPTIIRSRERMTYTQVNEILNNPFADTKSLDSQTVSMLSAMHVLALALIRRRENRGAIDFDLPEAELLFNDEGQIGGIVRSERNIAHRLIEEFMLLANETAASHLEALGMPLPYRVHEEPNPARVEEFAEIAVSFGHKFSTHGPVPQRGFQRLARDIRGRPEERMLSYLMLRSMQRARYTPQNLGHFGLAMKTYTHFTSPIRRYPDLIVHRVLRELLTTRADQEDASSAELGSRRALSHAQLPVISEAREVEIRRSLEIICEHSSTQERAAADAERELMDWRRATFMADRVGEEFEGVISGVRDYGFWVELFEFFVEGLVHVSTLQDDTYHLDGRKHRLVGGQSHRIFRLGDVVRVVVDRVDPSRHRINLSLSD
jgi:ribonuclease R